MAKIIKKRLPCGFQLLGRFWCPEKKWFAKRPCGFENKNECDNFKEQCGVAR